MKRCNNHNCVCNQYKSGGICKTDTYITKKEIDINITTKNLHIPLYTTDKSFRQKMNRSSKPN